MPWGAYIKNPLQKTRQVKPGSTERRWHVITALDLSPGTQALFNFQKSSIVIHPINRTKEKSDHFDRDKKVFIQVNIHSCEKLQQIRERRESPGLTNSIYGKSAVNIPNSRKRQRHLLPFIQDCTGSSSQCNKARKKKRNQDWEEINKTSTRIVSDFDKVTGCKIYIQKSNAFYIPATNNWNEI